MDVTCGDAIVGVVAVASAATTTATTSDAIVGVVAGPVAADLVVTMTRDRLREPTVWLVAQQESLIRRWQRRCVQC
jgi:hypothetical protein